MGLALIIIVFAIVWAILIKILADREDKKDA